MILGIGPATAEGILQAVAIGISSWTLVEVVRQGKALIRVETKMEDLPCQKDKCTVKNNKTK